MTFDAREIEARILEASPDPWAIVRRHDIGPLLGKNPLWFDSNRRRLMAAGFPRPFTRGRWWKREVTRWIFTLGKETSPAELSDAGTLQSIREDIDAYFAGRKNPANTNVGAA